MTPFFSDEWLTVYGGDCRAVLRDMEPESVHCVVTSPPYFGLRDYGTDGQIGLEKSAGEYVAVMTDVFREVRRVLRADGTLWLNLGDSYAGSWGAQGRRVTASDDKSWHGSQIKNHPKRASLTGAIRDAGVKPKDLLGIPWRVAFALQADGWYLRSDIVWSKPNPMPESVTDRPTKSHEYVFLLSKSARYFYDADAVREPHQIASIARAKRARTGGKYNGSDPAEHGAIKRGANYGPDGDHEKIVPEAGRNLRSVWTIATAPYPGAHFATFPPKLVEPCVKAGCPADGTVLDPFAGTGTVGLVAQRLSRRAVLIDLNPDYLRQCLARNAQTPLGLPA